MAATDGEVSYVEHPRLVPGTIEAREYQDELVDTARTDHTLVCLPTGLGKTTVSLRITADRLDGPDDSVLFLAPTKPLVEQHAAFYRESLDLADSQIVVFTGEVSPNDREQLWQDATVIIATPQVIENDLIGGRISLRDVVHLTFDECHRATGEYAYNFIAERYHDTADRPLVTGMSASPGGSKEAILTVCRNLGLRQLAVKTEDDETVAPYTYETEVEWETVALPDEIKEIRDALKSVIEERLEELASMGVTRSTDPELSQRELNKMRGKLQSLIDSGNSDGYRGMSLHAEVMKLKRAVEIAETQSIESLRRYLERQQESARSSSGSKASQRLVSDPRVQRAKALAEEYDELHPKFSQARIRIARTLGIGDGERVIVFTESRDTAEVLTAFLDESFDARRFVGQGNRDGSDGMTQKQQQAVLDAFRANEFDVLVSTSVAEEGLDVPEVDLVLFFEPVPTAIRAIQRRGRTGRHAPGTVVVLMAEDTRDEAYFWISRRREDEMVDELEALKHMEGDIESALGGSQETLDGIEESEGSRAPTDRDAEPTPQTGLADFDADSGDDGEAGVVASAGADEAVEIVADQRELDATIGRDLSARDGFEVRLETLAVGDYVLSDRVVVERKTAEDFLDSLLSGDRSLFGQVRAMATHYDRPVLIVEGPDLYDVRDVHPNAVRGALVSLVVDYGASLLFASNATETTEILAIIAEREQSRGGREVSVHGEKGGRTVAEQQEYVVSSIADIGPVTARSLLEAFGSVEAVMTANENELTEIHGVGEVTAARVRDVVGSSYDPD